MVQRWHPFMCVATLLIVAIVDAIAFHPDGIQAPDASADPVPTNGGGSSSSKASRIEEFVGKNNNNKTNNNNNNNSTFGSTREIFVAGCGHSGTTVMLRLIGQLSAIFPVRNPKRKRKGKRKEEGGAGGGVIVSYRMTRPNHHCYTMATLLRRTM